MATAARPVQFNAQLMAEDMAAQGLNKIGLANKARVSDMAVIRFLRGDRQTAPMAKKLARALGHKVTRYIVRREQMAAAS